jgi:CRISPR/Cas system-associated endonuclease/helicase Cas3
MEAIMLFKYYPIPLMDEIDASGGAASVEVTTQNTEPEGTQAQSSGTADPIPDGNKPDAAWAEMRRKAKLADDLLKENEGYKSKFEKINKKALPEGYKSVDEYLEYLDGLDEVPFTPEPEKPAIDENKIIDAILKKVTDLPVIKSVQKERQDRFLVNSFSEAQKAFTDIKKPEDIPLDVWNAWDEGKSNRTLLSHLKEYRYDMDIENARKTGANQAKATVMSTAHTAQVNGANAASEYDNVTVPDEVRKNLERVGIKDPLKQKMAYAKHGLKR